MASATSLAEKKRLARRFPEEVATGGDIDLIDEICTPNVREHTSMGDREGREALKAHSREIHAAFPDLSVSVEDTVAQGDTVAQRLTFRGTHEGPYGQVGATGEEVEVANVLFTRIEDDLIAERWLEVDVLGLLEQVGAVERPGD